MSLPAVPGVFKLIASGAQNAWDWANIFHWAYTGGAPSPLQLSSIANQFGNAWTANITPLQTVDTSITQVEAVDLSTVMSPAVAVAVGVSGTNGEDPLPGSVCGLATYGVSMRWRGGHPRNYYSIGGDGDLYTAVGNYNQWGSDFITAASLALENFTSAVSAITAGGVSLTEQVCVRYVSGGAPLVTPLVLPLGPPVFQQMIATQRRRIGRR